MRFTGLASDGILIALAAALLPACGRDADDEASRGTGGSPSGGGSVGAAGAAGSGGTPSGGGSETGGAASGAGAGGTAGGSGSCVRARLLWSEDFETGDYSRWTSNTYGGDWMDGVSDCEANGFSSAEAVSPTHSHRSEITCAFTESHRGYGGLQFDGDQVVPAYTNAGSGIDAPYGVVNTFHSRLETPHVYGGGEVTWFSFWTVHHDCGWNGDVLTLGLEDPSHRLAAAHFQPGGGTRSFAGDAPSFPLHEWVRITIYVNYYDGVMHVWQNGQDVSHVTFVRPAATLCQWHWGAYASSDNYDVVLYEDDNSIYRLEEPWTDFTTEPHLGGSVSVCEE